jgi:hypothetical protein
VPFLREALAGYSMPSGRQAVRAFAAALPFRFYPRASAVHVSMLLRFVTLLACGCKQRSSPCVVQPSSEVVSVGAPMSLDPVAWDGKRRQK